MSEGQAMVTNGHANKARERALERPRTLCVDIGGTGLKALVLGPDGAQLTERARVETPRPATPRRVLDALREILPPSGACERASVGFPGVVVEGTVQTAPNLHASWKGFALADELRRRLRVPVRVLNDAGVQGFGVIERRGVEMVLTLGTGLGCSLFVDGTYVPNIELAHHPLRRHETYEDYVGKNALDAVGKKKWNKRVRRVLAQVQPVFNPRRIYLGGGNAKHLKGELPANVKVTDNLAGLLGGIALWRDA